MTFRVGFLGYGFMARAHANALARLPMFFPDAPETERHVVVGRDESALADAADRLGFANTSTDWEEILDEVDLLYNLGPNHLHAEPSIAALDRNVHVLCEKPLAADLEAARRMADAAAASDAVAAIGFNYRYVPAIALAKRLIDDGDLGEIRSFRGRYLQDWLLDPAEPWSWRLDADLAGSGALGDLGAHTIDLARYFVGDLDRVSGHLHTFVEERPAPGGGDEAADEGEGSRAVTVDDAFTALAAFENGAMGRFEASRVAAGHLNDHTIAVHGTEGSLRFSLERPNELELKRPGARGYERVLVTDETDPYVEAWWPPGHVLGWEHTFVHQSYELLSAIEGDGSYAPDFADGLAVQAALAAIQASDEDRSWRTVADPSDEW